MIEGGNYLNISDHYKMNQTQMDTNGKGVVSVGSLNDRFPCAVCGKSYLRKRHLQRHMRDECIGIPPRFSCDLCPSRFRRKYHMVRHLTSKHGIPPAIAQQTTGNSNRNHNSCSSLQKDENDAVCAMTGENLSINHHNRLANCDDGLPENLTMRKENYESKPTQFVNHHHLNGGGGSASPAHITSGDSGSDCNGGGTTGTSPVPPANHIMPIPTYGLTGAITAISAAAAHVEEKDAKILLEAAAAAAAAANNSLAIGTNTINTITMPLSNCEDNENFSVNQMKIATTAPSTSAASPGNNTKEIAFIKSEPLTPNKTAASTAASATMNMLDDEWKMKLSLQLISNSLLKERLMNTMPFAYKNN